MKLDEVKEEEVWVGELVKQLERMKVRSVLELSTKD